MIKTCFKCHKAKPLDEFYTHPKMADGHLGKCKECAKADVRHREHLLRGNVAWIEKERARGREKHHRLYSRGRNWRSPSGTPQQKKQATGIVARAVRSGKIRRPNTCNDCGASGKRLHGHHEDYSKPLAVVWVCPTCHRRRHATIPDRIKPSESK